MWPVILAVGAVGAAAVYEEWPKLKSKLSGAGGFSKPPIVNGYQAPPVPAGTPPSWSYQGPPVPPAQPPAGKPAPAPIQIVLAPGIAKSTPPKGATMTFSLPPGGYWDPNDAVLCPTSIGGDLSGNVGSDPCVLTGVQGAGTIQFNWFNSSGQAQQTLFDINVTG